MPETSPTPRKNPLFSWLRRIFGVLRFSTKGVLTLFLVGAMALNIATLTVQGVFVAMSGLVGSVAGVSSTVMGRNAARVTAQKAAVKTTSKRVSRRAARAAVRNTASLAGEAIPFAGAAVIAGGLYFELTDACAMARDMAELEANFDGEADPERVVEDFNCYQELAAQVPEFEQVVPDFGKLPSAEDLPDAADIWGMMKDAPLAAWDAAAGAMQGVDLPSVSPMEAFSALHEFVDDLLPWGDKAAPAGAD